MAPWFVLAPLCLVAGMLLAWFALSNRIASLRCENLGLRESLECDRQRWAETRAAWQVVEGARGANLYPDDSGSGLWWADPYRKGFLRGSGSSPIQAALAMKISPKNDPV